MTDRTDSEGGRLTLGQRVHRLEHDQAQIKKKLRRIEATTGLDPNNKNVTAWVGKRVVLVPAVAGKIDEAGVLKKVYQYTYLVDTVMGPTVFSKGQILKIRLAE